MGHISRLWWQRVRGFHTWTCTMKPVRMCLLFVILIWDLPLCCRGGLVQHMTWEYSKISWLLIIANFHIHHQVRLWNYLTRMCLNLTSSSKRHDMRDLLMQGSFTWLMRDTQTGRAACHHTNVQGTMWSNGKTAPHHELWKKPLTMHMPELGMS